MAGVKTFRIHPEHGVPDKDIREFINMHEREAFVAVHTSYIPGRGTVDPRLTVIITKLDDFPLEAINEGSSTTDSRRNEGNSLRKGSASLSASSGSRK